MKLIIALLALLPSTAFAQVSLGPVRPLLSSPIIKVQGKFGLWNCSDRTNRMQGRSLRL